MKRTAPVERLVTAVVCLLVADARSAESEGEKDNVYSDLITPLLIWCEGWTDGWWATVRGMT